MKKSCKIWDLSFWPKGEWKNFFLGWVSLCFLVCCMVVCLGAACLCASVHRGFFSLFIYRSVGRKLFSRWKWRCSYIWPRLLLWSFWGWIRHYGNCNTTTTHTPHKHTPHTQAQSRTCTSTHNTAHPTTLMSDGCVQHVLMYWYSGNVWRFYIWFLGRVSN